MDHGAVPRLDLRGGDPAILAEPGIDHELLVIDDPLRRHAGTAAGSRRRGRAPGSTSPRRPARAPAARSARPRPWSGSPAPSPPGCGSLRRTDGHHWQTCRRPDRRAREACAAPRPPRRSLRPSPTPADTSSGQTGRSVPGYDRPHSAAARSGPHPARRYGLEVAGGAAESAAGSISVPVSGRSIGQPIASVSGWSIARPASRASSASARSRRRGSARRVAAGVLVVDPPPVADHAALVEHDHRRGARGPEPGRDLAVAIREDRERDAVHRRKPADRLVRFAPVGGKGDERDPLRPKPGGQLGQPPGIELGQGTFGRDKRDHQQPPIPSASSVPDAQGRRPPCRSAPRAQATSRGRQSRRGTGSASRNETPGAPVSLSPG